jgi:hypothetical protein
MASTIPEFLANAKQGGLTNLALLLGPRAGTGVWHGDALGHFLYGLGPADIGPGLWRQWSSDARAALLRDCFRLEDTQAGNEALGLIATMLSEPVAPRIYWPDPHDTLLRAMVDDHALPYLRAVKVTELHDGAIVESLDQPDNRIVDLGAAVFPVDFSNDEITAGRIYEVLRARLFKHSHVLMWGWTGALAQLTELLPPRQFPGTVGVVEPGDRLAELGYAYNPVACLPKGSLQSDGERAEAVLDALKQICPPPGGPLSPPRGMSVSPGGGTRSTSAGGGSSTGVLSDHEIISSVAQRLGDHLNPHLEAPAARILGLVVDPGIVRTALAASLTTRVPGAVHLRVDDPADLAAAATLAPGVRGSPAMTALDTSTALPEPDVRAYMSSRHGAGDDAQHPEVVVLMPSLDATWAAVSDAKLENLRLMVPRALQGVLNDVLPEEVPEATRRDIARWACSDPASTLFQVKLQSLVSVLTTVGDDTPVLLEQLVELIEEDHDDTATTQMKAPIRLKRRKPPPSPPPSIRLRKRPD